MQSLAEIVAYNEGAGDAAKAIAAKAIDIMGDGAAPDTIPFSTLSDLADTIDKLMKPLPAA